MINRKIYKDEIIIRTIRAADVFIEEKYIINDPRASVHWDNPLLKEFLEDDILDVMTVSSGSHSFQRTFIKQLKSL